MKVEVEAATEAVAVATGARHREPKKREKATRAAEIQADQRRKQTQAEASFLLAQPHRNRHGPLLSATGQEGQVVDAGQEATAESCAHRQCQRQ